PGAQGAAGLSRTTTPRRTAQDDARVAGAPFDGTGGGRPAARLAVEETHRLVEGLSGRAGRAAQRRCRGRFARNDGRRQTPCRRGWGIGETSGGTGHRLSARLLRNERGALAEPENDAGNRSAFAIRNVIVRLRRQKTAGASR